MKIAYLVVCHLDPPHIRRLASRLTLDDPEAGVFILIDRKSPCRREIREAVGGMPHVHVLPDEIDIWWSGPSQIDATLLLLHASCSHGDYQRFVMLQGADYPLRSNSEIRQFFAAHPDVEYIRACNVTVSRRKFLYSRSKHVFFYDRVNFAKRVANRLTRILDLQLRPSGQVRVGDQRWDIYWGCGQWAITRRCAEYVMRVSATPGLRRQFQTIFPSDELYVHTLVFNSPFRHATSHGEEGEADSPAALRNLHYFEYPPGHVKIFTASDYEHLRTMPDLFMRKVRTPDSSALLDRLDADNYAVSLAGHRPHGEALREAKGA